MLSDWKPRAIYYLAAVHGTSEAETPQDDELFASSLAVHVQYPVNICEAISASASAASFFFAGSSHVFAGSSMERQDESTPMTPESVYGITKAAGIEAMRFYRKKRGVRASVGILYNHESHLRAAGFVSRKIAIAAARAARGSREQLVLGDLSAQVDWGYAPDYVDAMIRIACANEPDDFVVATGKPHTVRDFVDEAFRHAGVDWAELVVEKQSLLARRPSRLVGDSTKLRERTGWEPRLSFREMVHSLVDHAMAEQ